MKPIPITPETLAVAGSIVWFEPPEKALADPIRFMAYAMTYALPEDMRFIRRFVSDDDFREALEHAPAGIIDPRSWAYWNSKMGRYPPPPQPVRHFGVAIGSEELDAARKVVATAPIPHRAAGLEQEQRYGAMAGLRMRQQQAEKLDAKEVSRRAIEKWRAEFGPKKKD